MPIRCGVVVPPTEIGNDQADIGGFAELWPLQGRDSIM